MTTQMLPGAGSPPDTTPIIIPVLTEIEVILNQIIKIYENRKIDKDSLIVLIVKVMELVEKTRESGPEKKQMVLDILSLVIDRSGLIEDKVQMHFLVTILAPSIIDNLIAAYKKQVNFSVKKMCCC